MKLTILGKYGPFPPAGGATSGYLVESGDTAVALDFGSGALSRLQTLRAPNTLDGIVLSHLHNDHIADLLPLCYAADKIFDLYIPDCDCPQRAFLETCGCFRLIHVSDGEKIRIGSLDLRFTRMAHPLESFAVRVTGEGTLFYSGDTVYNDRITPAAAGASLLLLDCAQPAGSSSPHMTLSEGARLQKELGVRALVTHVHPAFDPAADAAALRLEIAEEGKTYFF